MKRSKYFALCQNQETEWLKEAAEKPTEYMTATHISIILLVLRKRGAYEKCVVEECYKMRSSDLEPLCKTHTYWRDHRG